MRNRHPNQFLRSDRFFKCDCGKLLLYNSKSDKNYKKSTELIKVCSKYSVNENQTSLSKLYFINLNTECYLLLSILCLQHLRDTCSAHPNIEVNLPFKCSHCQERLRTQRALDIHVGRWHAGLLNTFDLNWICRIHLPASSILTSQAGNKYSI